MDSEDAQKTTTLACGEPTLGKMFRKLKWAIVKTSLVETCSVGDPGKIIERMLRALELCGITDGVVRYGMAHDLAVPLFLLAADGGNPSEVSSAKLARWRACLRFDTSGKMVPDEMFWSRFADNLRRFETWASIAKIDDLIRLNPPDPDIWSSINLNPMEERPVIASYKWLCDRYLRGDPNTWSTNSLYKEYLFIHDGDTDTFAPMALEPIRVSEMELNAAIAERAVRQASYENESMLYEQIFESAKLFLQENNYRMAAALFKFYLTQNPQNTNALNSMGFCLIPESPAEAESIIRDAISRGYRCACLAAYNLCCCQILQQDLESALRVADNYRIHIYGTPEDWNPNAGALIWKLDSNKGCILHDSMDVRFELSALCIRLSERLDDSDRLRKWVKFQDCLSSAKTTDTSETPDSSSQCM